MTVVRKALAEDLKEVQRLNHALFLWDLPNDPALDTNWPYQQDGEDYFMKRISEETGVCFVAEADGKLVGYVTGHVNKAVDSGDTLLRCELDNIFVEDNVRGKGVGHQLIAELDRWCRQKGAESMFVSAYSGNVKAIEFYKKYGFEPYAIKLERKL